jgi:hypothetical protein
VWATGNTLYEINNLIQDYIYPTDEGKIDASNMYKAMYAVGNIYTSVSQQCTTIPEQSVAAVFDFGADLLTQTYNCALTQTDGNYRTSAVVKTSGTVSSALIGWSYTENSGDTKTTRNAMQGYFDSSTNQVIVNMAYLVNYPDNTYYSVRIHVDGYTTSGEFTLKLIKYGNSGIIASIAGYGFSQGDDYYLFKVTSSNVRNLAFSNLPFIMSLNLSLGDIEYENIDCDSEWGIPTNGGFDCSFG